MKKALCLVAFVAFAVACKRTPGPTPEPPPVPKPIITPTAQPKPTVVPPTAPPAPTPGKKKNVYCKFTGTIGSVGPLYVGACAASPLCSDEGGSYFMGECYDK